MNDVDNVNNVNRVDSVDASSASSASSAANSVNASGRSGSTEAPGPSNVSNASGPSATSGAVEAADGVAPRSPVGNRDSRAGADRSGGPGGLGEPCGPGEPGEPGEPCEPGGPNSSSGAPHPHENAFDFDTPVDRRGTWCTQWDYTEDRFGVSDLLPFTISDMDLATAPPVLTALRSRLDHGVLGYSRWRNEDFRSAVTHWYETRYATRIDPGHLVYGPSVLYQISQLVQLWSKPGDGVVVHTPAYDAFPRLLAAHGRELRGCPLDKDADGEWTYDPQQLEALLARPDTSVLLLCSPHNPTGRVWTEDELTWMADACERHGVAVISDEIHSDLSRSPHRHLPWSRLGSERAGRWAVVTSASKSFNIPALTGSYGLIGDRDSREAYLYRLKEADGLSSPAVLSLVGHIAAYRQGDRWLDALCGYVERNMRMVTDRLNAAYPQLGLTVPQAGYLLWLDLRPLAIEDDQLQRLLIDREKVAIMPGSTYGPQGAGFLRLNVGCPRAKAEAGVDALLRALDTLV